MRPKLDLLSSEQLARVLNEAFQLLRDTGIKVQCAEARALLAGAGAAVDEASEVARLPENVARDALASVPPEFALCPRGAGEAVCYGGVRVHFDPGSSGVHVLDPDTKTHRSSTTPDLIRIIQVAEALPQIDAQSTSVLCDDVPKDIGDIYRLFLVLAYSTKPIVTGSFNARSNQNMIDLLAIFAGGRAALAEKPLAVFDVCPSPPLIWSEFASQTLIDLAREGVPAEIVSMPLAGAAAPVTLLGSVVQHAAECIGGMTIHQLAKPGSPIVWGGAPAIMDMRHGTTPMGAIETAMIDAAYAQVGQSLNVPTHAYLGASDAKIVDAQAGLESGITALIGALAGINMISGAGMLDFLACFSLEKLVIDAEAIGMSKRLIEGMKEHTHTLALELFTGIDFKGEFLKHKATRDLFGKEQFLPSPVLDRGSIRAWRQGGSLDAFARARVKVNESVAAYQPPPHDPDAIAEARALMLRLAREAGMDALPEGAEVAPAADGARRLS